MTSFALRLKELRKNKKMSQQELATFLGMKRENISNYERGVITNVSSDTLEKISELFDVSIDYLLGKSDTSNQKNESMVKQVMMRMDTDGLSSKQVKELEDEMERFFSWRIEEIKKENLSE